MTDIYELLEITKEHDSSPPSENEIRGYIEECGKNYFQASGQYERPSEFLQTLLDMIRVIYEPTPLAHSS
jgi:hypothetical protein